MATAARPFYYYLGTLLLVLTLTCVASSGVAISSIRGHQQQKQIVANERDEVLVVAEDGRVLNDPKTTGLTTAPARYDDDDDTEEDGELQPGHQHNTLPLQSAASIPHDGRQPQHQLRGLSDGLPDLSLWNICWKAQRGSRRDDEWRVYFGPCEESLGQMSYSDKKLVQWVGTPECAFGDKGAPQTEYGGTLRITKPWKKAKRQRAWLASRENSVTAPTKEDNGVSYLFGLPAAIRRRCYQTRLWEVDGDKLPKWNNNLPNSGVDAIKNILTAAWSRRYGPNYLGPKEMERLDPKSIDEYLKLVIFPQICHHALVLDRSVSEKERLLGYDGKWYRISEGGFQGGCEFFDNRPQ